MAQAFAAAFWTAAHIIAGIAGAAAAVLLAVAFLALLAVLLGVAFNFGTGCLARRWERTGRRPKGRWAEIITASERRAKDGSNGEEETGA